MTPPPSGRTTVRRLKDRGRYDAATVHAILDEGLVCHVGVTSEHGPVVLPTTYARIGETLYLHGARANALLRAAVDRPVCATVTLLDGLVLARSAFHHSMNYRSVVVFGTATEVVDADEARSALEALVDHVAPGRSAGTRGPTPEELRATLVLSLPLDEASAKVRTGPPKDDEADLVLEHWAGVLPLALVPQAPVPDPGLDPAVALPDHVAGWARPGRR